MDGASDIRLLGIEQHIDISAMPVFEAETARGRSDSGEVPAVHRQVDIACDAGNQRIYFRSAGKQQLP